MAPTTVDGWTTLDGVDETLTLVFVVATPKSLKGFVLAEEPTVAISGEAVEVLPAPPKHGIDNNVFHPMSR